MVKIWMTFWRCTIHNIYCTHTFIVMVIAVLFFCFSRRPGLQSQRLVQGLAEASSCPTKAFT